MPLEVNVKTRYLWIILVAFIASACAGTIAIKTDYDTSTSFSKYHTIAVKQGNFSGNPVMDQRIFNNVVEALQAKGYRIVPEDLADAIAVVNAATREKHTYEVFYDSWPGWGWRYGWARPVVQEYDFTVGTVVVDVFDAATKRAVWHGWAENILSEDPERDAKKIQQAVTKLLDRFPPQTKQT